MRRARAGRWWWTASAEAIDCVVRSVPQALPCSAPWQGFHQPAGQEPECLVARKYGKNRLDRVLGIARDLKSVRNDIAHNPLELCSGALTIYDATTTRLTGDVSYAKQYTLEQLLEIRMQVNGLLKEIRLMQVECGD